MARPVCDCLKQFNSEMKTARMGYTLATCLCVDFKRGDGYCVPKLAVEKTDAKRGSRPPTIVPSYCPFCGKKYLETKPSKQQAKKVLG